MIEKAFKTFHATDYHAETVIGEFSGRDSVAAILKAFQSDDINYILPIASFAGTEYGNYNSIYDNYEKLQKRVMDLYGEKKRLYPLLEYNDEKLWHILNGRFASLLVKKYGFYNPCIGCHLYFHLTKLKFSNPLSGRILSGERESHDGRIKVNQLHETLETYKKVLGRLDAELMMPLQACGEGTEVESLIGWTWEEGKDHPQCVLSGNYRDLSGKAIYEEKALNKFLDEYITVIGEKAGQYVLGGLSEDDLIAAIKAIL